MMMIILRCLLVIVCSLGGAVIFWEILKSREFALVGGCIGFIIAILILFVEQRVKNISLKAVVGGILGLSAGLIIANLFSYALLFYYPEKSLANLIIYLLINCLIGFLGLGIGAKKGEEFAPGKSGAVRSASGNENHKILDTSAIIDGRIADIFETGFVEGILIIPQFVLQELVYIADSSDSLRRTRGKRGLDILNRIQKQDNMEVKIVDQDFPKIKEVDAKLVALAKKMDGKIFTNDFNLNKVAELQGVQVLNVNELAHALRPVVLPGELMKVYVQREGKEQGQGVAYLDDGTMVVIDNGRKFLGKNIEVTVNSVLQTTAGRMIFTVLKGGKSLNYLPNPGR
ncbi:MAG: TRAM domain-containing protein [Deltaproteobacteria bacterium]|nr:TRAM domain-containing protein [Deltaproteobacteria bacterium]